jgi:hypothetical protein
VGQNIPVALKTTFVFVSFLSPNLQLLHMADDSLVQFIKILVLGTILLTFLLIAFEDGVQFGLLKRLLCKMGVHRLKTKIGRLKINRYYCQNCKTPRKHPQLKIVEGGNKMGTNDHKF